jgi:hypothetical protein
LRPLILQELAAFRTPPLKPIHRRDAIKDRFGQLECLTRQIRGAKIFRLPRAMFKDASLFRHDCNSSHEHQRHAIVNTPFSTNSLQ